MSVDKILRIGIPKVEPPEGGSWNLLGKNIWEKLTVTVPADLEAVHRNAGVLAEKMTVLSQMRNLHEARLSETITAAEELSREASITGPDRLVSSLSKSNTLPFNWRFSKDKVQRMPNNGAANEITSFRADLTLARALKSLAAKADTLRRDLVQHGRERAEAEFHRQLILKAIKHFESSGQIPPWRAVSTSRKIDGYSERAHRTTMAVGKELIEREAIEPDSETASDVKYSSYGFKGIEAFKEALADSLQVSEVTIYDHLRESGVWIEGKRGKRDPNRVDRICENCIEYYQRHSQGQ